MVSIDYTCHGNCKCGFTRTPLRRGCIYATVMTT